MLLLITFYHSPHSCYLPAWPGAPSSASQFSIKNFETLSVACPVLVEYLQALNVRPRFACQHHYRNEDIPAIVFGETVEKVKI
jgi:hypothetical protein